MTILEKYPELKPAYEAFQKIRLENDTRRAEDEQCLKCYLDAVNLRVGSIAEG